ASELASLTPRSFDLRAVPATVTIEAPDEKARRDATLPLPSDLVALLQPWFESHALDALLWPGKWAKHKAAGKMIRSDLKAARLAWLDALQDPADRESLERSGFLSELNAEGEVVDFHCLRHTYLSRLGRSGASPKVMMEMARHTTVELTLGRYSH